MENQLAKELARAIFRECSEYLRSSNHTLYRGIESDEPHHLKSDVNKERVPVDSSNELTSALNKLHDQIGSPVTRNNCIFATIDAGAAREYGRTYVIFPIGAYHALWNNQIKDAYVVFEKHNELTTETIDQSFFTDLKNDPLEKVEVMITCDSYYAVEKEFYENYVLWELDELRCGNFTVSD